MFDLPDHKTCLMHHQNNARRSRNCFGMTHGILEFDFKCNLMNIWCCFPLLVYFTRSLLNNIHVICPPAWDYLRVKLLLAFIFSFLFSFFSFCFCKFSTRFLLKSLKKSSISFEHYELECHRLPWFNYQTQTFYFCITWKYTAQL